MKIITSETGSVLIGKREQMTKQAWISNVTRIHPEKALEEVEALYEKLFGQSDGPVSSGTPCSFNEEDPDRVEPL